MNEDLIIIKKHYGENMMKLCRRLFPTFLEKKGLLSKLMLDNFEPSRFLYDDIVSSDNVESFKNYLFSLVDMTKTEAYNTKQSPKNLMSDAGYILYECKSEDDIQKFKKYYAAHEELCTFNGRRLKTCHVFFAVKKNVDEIKRENFKHPRREDDYGVSVISIQFTRGGTNTLSIKNRYNHTVSNPDATFANDLENIIPGLTASFEKEYGLNINSAGSNILDLPNYVKAADGKFYKYNIELNNIYYCPNNIIIDNFGVKRFDKERYLVVDNYIIDRSLKTIELYDKELKDCFVNGFQNIQKIEVTTDKKTGSKLIEIFTTDGKITLGIDKTNQIIEYINSEIELIDEYFMYCNRSLKRIDLPNVKEVKRAFLFHNKCLKELKLPSLEVAGREFLFHNEALQKLELLNLRRVNDAFLLMNQVIEEVNMPNLVMTGDEFLFSNERLQKVSFPKLESIGNSFLSQNIILSDIYTPLLKLAGYSFLCSNDCLCAVSFPELEKTGNFFLSHNKKMRKFYAPKLREVGNAFLSWNHTVSELYAPNLSDEIRTSLQSNLLPQELKDLYEIPIKHVRFLSKRILNLFKLSEEKLKITFSKNNFKHRK